MYSFDLNKETEFYSAFSYFNKIKHLYHAADAKHWYYIFQNRYSNIWFFQVDLAIEKVFNNPLVDQ